MRLELAVLITVGLAPLAAQEAPANRIVHVVVNDPMKRTVTGLTQLNFDVAEDGSPLPVTEFTGTDAPISIAIVAQSIPAGVLTLRRRDDEIVQAQTVADALQVLAASKNSRKALIFTAGTIAGEIPREVQVLRADPENLLKSVLEVENSYSLRFSSSRAAGVVEVHLKPPAGLPPLTLTTR